MGRLFSARYLKANLNKVPDIIQLAGLYIQLARMEEAGISHIFVARESLADTDFSIIWVKLDARVTLLSGNLANQAWPQ